MKGGFIGVKHFGEDIKVWLRSLGCFVKYLGLEFSLVKVCVMIRLSGLYGFDLAPFLLICCGNYYRISRCLNGFILSRLFSVCLLKTFPSEFIDGSACPVLCVNGRSILTVLR